MEAPKKPFQTGVVIGTVLMFGPLLGLFGTAFGMFRSFNALQDSGISDPKLLSHGVSLALLSTAVGISLFPIGLVVLIVSLVLRSRVRREDPPPLPPTPST